jgi:hypothetical protein
LVAAGIVEAKRDQTLHALLTHVAERHRRAGWVALFYHSSSSRSRTVLPPCISIALILSRSDAMVILREHLGEFWGKGESSTAF